MGNLCFPKRQRIRLLAFVCLFVEDTFDFRAKWNHKSENWKHKTETREESEKKLKNHNYNRLGEQTLLFNTHFLLISYHTASSSRWRFHCASGGANVPRCPSPRTRTADPPHPMHNATSASDGSPPPSSVIRLWSSVFGLLSSVWPACQLAITMRVRKCCDIETTDNATGTTRCYPLRPFTPIRLSPVPLLLPTAPWPLGLVKSGFNENMHNGLAHWKHSYLTRAAVKV